MQKMYFSCIFRDVANGKRTDKKEKRKSPLNGIYTKKTVLLPAFPVTTPIPLAEDKPILRIKNKRGISTLVLA
jgi:hypothetical protein